MQKIAIIVPCYEEGNRLKQQSFIDFLQDNRSVHIYFVDDGSRDTTPIILSSLKAMLPDQVNVITMPANSGKANAVRCGCLTASENAAFSHIGFLDADLSTDLQEFYRIYNLMIENQLDFAFGSRVKLMSIPITRSFPRHIIGRIIASIIDLKFKLGIYDTQCGAKWFSARMVKTLMESPFKTRWLFDVEIFVRMRKNLSYAKGMEIPLARWNDAGGSKISFFHFPAIVKEITVLMRSYKRP
jgi:glycosyltransferase involved in cell wall biosynthesis